MAGGEDNVRRNERAAAALVPVGHEGEGVPILDAGPADDAAAGVGVFLESTVAKEPCLHHGEGAEGDEGEKQRPRGHCRLWL